MSTADEHLDLNEISLTALCDHIESAHHRYLHDELPALGKLAAKVTRDHGERHPELTDIARVFRQLRDELEAHLAKEERILFPMIRQLDTASSLPGFHCGSIGNPIRVMRHEHVDAGQALDRLKQLTDDFQAPEGADEAHGALIDRLRVLEANTREHIDKEDNTLFPRATAREAAL